tara:strand:+ start:715 stop:1164 length:450 start_codon:yes stop_codon:yes gene_type:complete
MVAINMAGDLLSSKTYGYSLKRTSTWEQKTKRLLDIATVICTFVSKHKSDLGLKHTHVVVEGYAYSARGAQNDLAELQGVVKTQLYLMFNLVAEPIPASKARKMVLGRGRLNKEEILCGVKELGYNLVDHNQADALVVAYSHCKGFSDG